jgi:propionyl-CoA carboxylase alpha chain
MSIAMAAFTHRAFMDRAAKLSGQLPSHEREVGADFVVLVDHEQYPVQVVPIEGGYEVTLGKSIYRIISRWRIGMNLIEAEINDKPVCFQMDRVGLRYRLSHRGTQIDALVTVPRAAELSHYMLEKIPLDMSKFLLSPMPGLLVHLSVGEGDEVKAGQELAVVEAMKMENSLRATKDVKIVKVLAEQNETLVVDQPILEFE